MLIRHLEYFVTLAEEEHFGRAADLCGISQPTLSQAIRRLEADLGVALIVRGKRYEGLTPEGARVLPWGRQILADYGSLRDDLSGRRKGGLTGTLRLGVAADAMAAVPRLSAQFEARNPLARIAIETLAPADILRGLGAFTLDGGVLWADEAVTGNQELWHRALESQTMMFACPADHPFAAERSIAWADAATQPLVISGQMPAGVGTLRAGITCGSLAGVLAHLRNGLWCAIVPQGFAALLAPGDGIALRPLTAPAISRTLAGVTAGRMPPAPMVRALRDTLMALSPDV